MKLVEGRHFRYPACVAVQWPPTPPIGIGFGSGKSRWNSCLVLERL